jgi:hypothetical protein
MLDEHNVASEVLQQTYEKEDELQELVALNPQLLLRPADEEREYYLVRREQSVSVNENGSTYSLDHLMLTSDGIPVIVEVKRRSDARIYREVAAQVLDYAARLSTIPMQDIKDGLNEQYPEGCFTEEFWSTVEDNIQLEQMILIFVADYIPDSLKLLIEFMDRNLKNIEVYGVELLKHQVDGQTILYRTFIDPPKPQEKKTFKYATRNWTEDAFLGFMSEKGLSDCVQAVKETMDRLKQIGVSLEMGHGAMFPSCYVKYKGTRLFAIAVWKKVATGDLCTIDAPIRKLVSAGYLGEEEARELFSVIPGEEDKNDKSLYWETHDYTYISFRAISMEEGVSKSVEAAEKLKEYIDRTLPN